MLKHYHKGETADSAQLKALVLQSLDVDKAEDIATIDLSAESALADYMIIASGRSSRQVAALAEKLKERLHAAGLKDVRIEGATQCNWVVVDAGDIIVHLFRPEVREFYQIEKMWQSAPYMAGPESGGHDKVTTAR